MADHIHLWIEDGDRIVCTHCGIDLHNPTNESVNTVNAITIEVVPESTCPECGGGDEFFNRPKVGMEDGWWWGCYNSACPVGYYNPETGGVELTPTSTT